MTELLISMLMKNYNKTELYKILKQFKSIKTDNHQESLKEIEDSFHHQTVVSYHDSTDFCELQKSFGQGIGITVCGELDEEEEFDFNYYFPYFEGDGVTTCVDVIVEKRIEILKIINKLR